MNKVNKYINITKLNDDTYQDIYERHLRRDDEHPCHFYTGDPPGFNEGGRSSRSVQLLFVESHHVCVVKFFFFFSFLSSKLVNLFL